MPSLEHISIFYSPIERGGGIPPDPMYPDRELTWGERLSKDGFWLFDYLHIGYNFKHLRELAANEGINYDAGLEELRQKEILDESDPQHLKVKWK